MRKTLLLFNLFCLPLFTFGQVDINVKDGGVFYISPRAFVVVDGSGNLDIETGGEFIMDSQSNTFSSFWLGGNHTGADAEYRRYANPFTAADGDQDNDLLSPPVSGQAFNLFFANNREFDTSGTGENVLPATPAGLALFGPFEDDAQFYTYYNSSTTTPLAAGRGYLAASRSAATVKTLKFQGDISTTAVTANVNKSSGQFLLANLIGNPYTTYLSSAAVLTDMAASDAFEVDGVVIYYDDKVQAISGTTNNGQDANTWSQINNVNASTINIAPGQGFYVIADEDAIDDETFDFELDNRLRGFPSTSNDDFIAGRSNSSSSTPNGFNIDGSFKVILDNTTNHYSTDLYFIDNYVTRGVDKAWDARALSVPDFSINTRLVEDTTGNPLSMQCLPSTDLTSAGNDVAIPLHVRAQAGITYTISIDDVTLPSGASIYLHDTSNGSVTLLNNQDYTFNLTETLNGSGRFYLKNNSSVLSDEDFVFDTLSIISEIKTKTIRVEGFIASETTLFIYDMRGRLVNDYSLETNTSLNVFDITDYSQGVYVAKLVNSNNQVNSQKVIIK